jgi:hypothetical protein
MVGSFAEVVERMLTILPSFIIMSKSIPPGVEATMFSLTATIINLNQFILRAVIGSVVNDMFVGVTNQSLDKYYILTIIEIIGKLFPLLIISLLIPLNKDVDELQEKYINLAEISPLGSEVVPNESVESLQSDIDVRDIN